jgi:hypothetical protein
MSARDRFEQVAALNRRLLGSLEVPWVLGGSLVSMPLENCAVVPGWFPAVNAM